MFEKLVCFRVQNIKTTMFAQVALNSSKCVLVCNPRRILTLMENLSKELRFYLQTKVEGGTSAALSLWSNSMWAAAWFKWKTACTTQNVLYINMERKTENANAALYILREGRSEL